MTLRHACPPAARQPRRSLFSLLWWALLAIAFGAAPSVQAQTPLRVYELNGSYAETNFGPALVPNGGSLGSTGYTFAAGQGPNVSNLLSVAGEYTIEMVFRFDKVSSYNSILNFNNRTGDQAVYCQDGRVVFYPYTTGNGTAALMLAGQLHRVVITRNASTKVTTSYVDGVQISQVTDSSDYYVASAAGGILHFFRDNVNEDSAGFVDQIRYYPTVLTPGQVLSLGPPVSPWQSAVLAGNPTVTRFTPVSGTSPIPLDVGTFAAGSARSFEFVFTATGAGPSRTLLGSRSTASGAQCLKLHQYNNTGKFGVTTIGVADYVFPNSPTLSNQQVHAVYTSNGSVTTLYLNGVLQSGTVNEGLKITGRNGFAALEGTTQLAFEDNLDGTIAGFASYARALTQAEVTTRYNALMGIGPNYTPTITANVSVLNTPEGTVPTTSGTFGDLNGNSTVTITASVGTVTQNNTPGTWTWTGVVADGPVSSTVTITATDNAGASATTTFTNTITNVAPVVTITAPASGTQNAAVNFSFAAADPSTADQAAGFTWTINYGDFQSESFPAGTASPLVRTHTYSAVGSYLITAQARDKNSGLSAVASASITIVAPPPAEINVRGNGVTILDGSSTPTTNDNTQFGATATPLARTFTIENTGGQALSISSITVSGASAANFVVSGAPTSIAGGTSATFNVTFTPTPGALSQATITIANNDSDEASYDFAIAGSFTAPTVSSVLPSEGTTAGGTGLTITGTGFGGATTVTIGGVAATGVNVYSPSVLTCIAPAGTIGAKSVVVTNPTGSSAANALYTYATTTPGDVQALNVPVVGSGVFATLAQSDGGIVLAGAFSQVLGSARNHLARLNADGSLDTSFIPNPNQAVFALIQQPDGAILVAGNFTSVQGNGRNYLARIAANGVPDSFNPNPNNQVSALCRQPDGKILVGGSFTLIQGTARNRIARLNADGTLDTSFSPSIDGPVNCIALDASGNVLVGGMFTSVQSTGSSTSSAYQNFVRLSSSGVLDASFRPQPNGAPQALVVLPDGKIAVGGIFSTWQPNGAVSTTSRPYLARLNADGTLDTSYAPAVQGPVISLALQADGKLISGGSGAAGVKRWLPSGASDDNGFWTVPNGNIWSLALQPDGRVLLGGIFTTINLEARSQFARLHNNVATSSLTVPNSTEILWVRGGSAPEVSQVTFEQSTNGGSTWTSLGTPARVVGTANWRLTGLNLPDGVQLRARGSAGGGYFNGSSSVIEQVAGFTNAAPSDIVLSASTLPENNAPNAVVGTLSTIDGTSGDTFTYSLVPGPGSTHNASFTIVGNALRLTPVADFETQSAYAVRLRSTDLGGKFIEKSFVIDITNVNDVPSFLKGADITVPHSTTTAQTYNAWASAINDGDSTVIQSLTFNVTVTSGANLFTVAPALSSTGTLTFRPNGTAGTATVQVTLTDDATLGTPALTSAAQTFTITVQAPPLVPFLGSISPTSGPSTGGTTVTITGNNFGAVNAVSFGGTPAASFTVNSATSITAVTPAGTPGVANVTVATSGGTSATNPLFTYFAPTTTTLTSSQNPSVFLTQPTFTARAVSTQAGLSGQMELFIDNVLLESKAVDASGYATFTPPSSALLSGTRQIAAVYNGNGAVATFGTSSAALTQTVNRANLPITLTGLAQTYDGAPKPVGANVSIPAGYTATVAFNYAGSSTAPTNVGSYAIVATLDHPQFFGSATGTLVVAPAPVNLVYFDTLQAYDGTPRVASLATFPQGVPAVLSYQLLVNGVPSGSPSTSAPVTAGRYRLSATGTNPNYALASTTGELNVTKRGVSISLGRLSVTADGQPKPVSVTTVPAGVAVDVFYSAGGFAVSTAPSLPPAGGGFWRVDAVVRDTVSNVGSATGNLFIDPRVPAPITLTGPATTTMYDYTPVAVSVRPIRKGVAPTGTVILKRDGVEFYRAVPTAKGDVYIGVPPLVVRAQPYLITAEYTGDENYLPSTSATVAITSGRKVIQLPERLETKTYDGRPFLVSYQGRVFEGYTVNPLQVTYNGSRFGPIDAATARQTVNIVAPLYGPDIEVRETVQLLVNRRPASIRMSNLVQTIRPTLNHKPDIFVEPAGAPFLVNINGTQFTPEQVRIDNPGTYPIRAWISNPNYEPAEATGTFVLTLDRVAFSIGGLQHVYDGGGKSVSVTSTPPIPYSVTYNGSNQQPTAPGYYTVQVTPLLSGYGNGTSATMSIASRIGATCRDGDGSVGLGTFELRNANGAVVATSFPANIVPDATFGSPNYSYGNLTFLPVDLPTMRSRFAYWEGVSGYSKNYNPLQISFSTPQPPGAYNIVARYVIENLITPTAQGNGTVSGAGWYKAGDVARFTATPASGFIVERWVYNGQTVGTTSEAMIKIVKNGGAPTAVFVPGYFAIARSHPWYDKTFGTASFIRKSQPELPALSAGYVPLSSAFTATAVPASGFTFDRWELINAQPDTLLDFVTSPTASFRPIDPTKQAIAHAHFLERAPTMNVSIFPLDVFTPGVGARYYFGLRIDNTRAAAQNVRFHKIEVTGFRAVVPGQGDGLHYYYPSPRNQAEINANNLSLLTQAQRTALDSLGPVLFQAKESRNVDLGNIPAKTVAEFKTFLVHWKKFYLTSMNSREEMRLTVHIVADNYAQTFDFWRPLYWTDYHDFYN